MPPASVSNKFAPVNSYDLVLHPVLGGSTMQQAAIDDAFVKQGLRQSAENLWSWHFPTAEITLSPLTRTGPPVAYEVRVPFTTTREAMLEVLNALTLFAEQNGLQLTDVYLTRSVTRSDFGAVVKSFVAVAAYKGFPTEPESGGETQRRGAALSWPVVTALAVLVFWAALYFSYQMVSG